MNRSTTRLLPPGIICLLLGIAAGFLMRDMVSSSRGQANRPSNPAFPGSRGKLTQDSAAAYDPSWDKSYPQYQPVGKVLKACPDLKPGDVCPQDISIFGGAGKTSFASVDDVKDFETFCRECIVRKAKVMAERK